MRLREPLEHSNWLNTFPKSPRIATSSSFDSVSTAASASNAPERSEKGNKHLERNPNERQHQPDTSPCAVPSTASTSSEEREALHRARLYALCAVPMHDSTSLAAFTRQASLSTGTYRGGKKHATTVFNYVGHTVNGVPNTLYTSIERI
jgi:hypothetical protein